MKRRTLMTWLVVGTVLLSIAYYREAYAQETPIIDGQATVTLSWTPPTEYEPLPGETVGAPLDPADITGYVIYYGTESRTDVAGDFRPGCSDSPQGTRTDGSCYPNVIDLSDGSLTTVPILITVDQTTTFVFAAAAFVGAGEIANDEVSRYSNEAFKTVTLVIDSVRPGPPTSLTVDMTITCSTNLPNVTCSFTVSP